MQNNSNTTAPSEAHLAPSGASINESNPCENLVNTTLLKLLNALEKPLLTLRDVSDRASSCDDDYAINQLLVNQLCDRYSKLYKETLRIVYPEWQYLNVVHRVRFERLV